MVDVKTALNMTVLTVHMNPPAEKGALLAQNVTLQPVTIW